MNTGAQCVSLIGQIPYPLRFGYGFTLPASGLSTDDDPFPMPVRSYCADVVKHRFKGHMICPPWMAPRKAWMRSLSLLEVTATPNQRILLQGVVENTHISDRLVKNRY